MTQIQNMNTWSLPYLVKNKKRVTISRMDMLLVMYIKYELGEMNFLELKDRVRSINALSDWVEGFSVLDSAFSRFRYGGLVTPKVNSQFLILFHKKMFKNIDEYGVEDFPRVSLEEDSQISIDKESNDNAPL